MVQLVDSPGDVGLAIFKWLLRGDCAAAVLDEIQPMDPNSVAGLVRDERLRAAEVLAIWAYARAIGSLGDVESRRTSEMRRALRIPSGYDRECDSIVEMAKCTAGLSAAGLMSEPPQPIMAKISAVVTNYLSDGRTRRACLPGLRSEVFEHPGDRAFLRILQKLPGLGRLTGEVVDILAKAEQVRLASTAIRVTSTSLPPLYDCYLEACSVLVVTDPPPLYIEAGPINAYTTGADEPIVVISSMAVSLLNRPETVFVLGHELGHVLAGHVRYHTLAQFLARSAGNGLGSLLGMPMQLLQGVSVRPALLAWSRRSEFTGDRAGLLACQNREAALRVMMKLAGYPPASYQGMVSRSIVQQAAKYEAMLEDSTLQRFMNEADVIYESHPRVVARALDLLKWCDEGYYNEILRATPDTLAKMSDRICEDPEEHDLTTSVCRELVDWCVLEFSMSSKEAGYQVREMVFSSRVSSDSPLDCVGQVEMLVRKRMVDCFEYTILLLLVRDGEPVQVTMLVTRDSTWNRVPERIRREFIESGLDSHSYRLYPN